MPKGAAHSVLPRKHQPRTERSLGHTHFCGCFWEKVGLVTRIRATESRPLVVQDPDSEAGREPQLEVTVTFRGSQSEAWRVVMH